MCRYHWACGPWEVYCCQSNLRCTGNIDSDAIDSSYACTVSFVPLTSTVINPILFPEIIHIFKLRWLFSSDIQTVRFKNELERNITIKLGYANAKIYKCEDDKCPRPMCYKLVSLQMSYLFYHFFGLLLISCDLATAHNCGISSRTVSIFYCHFYRVNVGLGL